MTYREKLYSAINSADLKGRTPSVTQVADWIEIGAFVALAGAVIALAIKGIAVAVGAISLLTLSSFVSAFFGLLLTFAALLVLSIILDGIGEYREFVAEFGGDDEEEEVEDVRNRRV